MDSKGANTVNTMPVTPKARVHTSKSFHLRVTLRQLTIILAVTHPLKILVTVPHLNTVSRSTARRDTSNSSRATAKRVVTPTLPSTPTHHRVKKVSVV